MKQHETIIINFPGGIISPGRLFDILEITEEIQVENVRFGSRQQLFIEIPNRHFETFTAACKQKHIKFSTAASESPNMISSYASNGIFTNDTWLSQGVYKDIFDQFDGKASLKINICDSDQSFVPFFTGHINWIASPNTHFWFLYIRLPQTNQLYRYPGLIYTNDVMNVTRLLEKIIAEKTAMFYDDVSLYGHFLQQLIDKTVKPITQPIEQVLILPTFQLPYYEGFNRYGNQYWLGIYRRNELFPTGFLKNICQVCLDTKIGELYATPWKSIIIKSIQLNDRHRWDYLLGKYRINVRHAANELNWKVEDNNEDGLILKRHVIRHFDKEDVRTYGLCFAVKTKSNPGIFGSVIIRRKVEKAAKLKSQERYELLYTPGFNPNSPDYILYRDNVEKEYLGPYLVSLCKLFYESKLQETVIAEPEINLLTTSSENEKPVFKCKHCLTVYDEQLGDPEKGVKAGTGFYQLPADYCCPLCDAPKGDFITATSQQLINAL